MSKSVEFVDNLGTHGDAFYSALMNIHEGLDEAESHALNARLVLMMANQIGDFRTLQTLLSKARDIGNE